MIHKLLNSLIKIEFVNRYKKLSEQYSDFDNRLDKTNKKQLLSIYQSLDKSIVYESLDRVYSIGFNIDKYKVDMCTKLHNGLIEPYFFIENDKEKLYFHRFDFICRELDSDFGNKYNIPIYCSENELKQILKELLLVYEDFKREVIDE